METVWWMATVFSTGSAVAALLWVAKLTKECKALKRNEYYYTQKLNRIPQQIAEALDPVRVQLAAVVAGRPVSAELIRQGRLYWDVTADEAAALIAQEQLAESKGVMIVDVRSPKEYAVRHIPGAILIPVEELDQRGSKEIPITVGKVFVYCQSGERSRLACEYLSRQGYVNLYNIRDGLGQWKGPVIEQETVNVIHIQSRSRKPSGECS